MKKRIRNSLKTGLIIGIISGIGVTTIAQPVIQSVTAYLRQDIKYTLDGESVLKDKGALMYKDTVYVPLRAISNILGISVDFNDNTVMMHTEDTIVETPWGQENLNVLKEATIVDVLTAEGEIIVVENGKTNSIENYIIVNAKSAPIKHENNKRAYAFSDLEIGMKIDLSIKALTKSAPPIAIGPEIVIRADQEKVPAELQNVTYKNMEIIDVAEDFSRMTIATDTKDINTHVIVNISEETLVAHEFNRRMYRPQDLEVGQRVDVTVGPISTLSIPPQTQGVEIILK